MREYSVRVWFDPDDYDDAEDLEAVRAESPAVPFLADTMRAAAVLFAESELDIRLNDDDDMLIEAVEVREVGESAGVPQVFHLHVEKHWVAEAYDGD